MQLVAAGLFEGLWLNQASRLSPMTSEFGLRLGRFGLHDGLRLICVFVCVLVCTFVCVTQALAPVLLNWLA
jgi:hypothetical protein